MAHQDAPHAVTASSPVMEPAGSLEDHFTDFDAPSFLCDSAKAFILERYVPGCVVRHRRSPAFRGPYNRDWTLRPGADNPTDILEAYVNDSWVEKRRLHKPRLSDLLDAYLDDPYPRYRSVYSFLFHINPVQMLGTAVHNGAWLTLPGEGSCRRGWKLPTNGERPKEALDPTLESEIDDAWPHRYLDFNLRDANGSLHQFRMAAHDGDDARAFHFTVRDPSDGRLVAFARSCGVDIAEVMCVDQTLMDGWASHTDLPDPIEIMHGRNGGNTLTKDVFDPLEGEEAECVCSCPLRHRSERTPKGLLDMRSCGHSERTIASVLAEELFLDHGVERFANRHQIELLFALAYKCKREDFGTKFRYCSCAQFRCHDPIYRLQMHLQEALVLKGLGGGPLPAEILLRIAQWSGPAVVCDQHLWTPEERAAWKDWDVRPAATGEDDEDEDDEEDDEDEDDQENDDLDRTE